MGRTTKRERPHQPQSFIIIIVIITVKRHHRIILGTTDPPQILAEIVLVERSEWESLRRYGPCAQLESQQGVRTKQRMVKRKGEKTKDLVVGAERSSQREGRRDRSREC